MSQYEEKTLWGIPVVITDAVPKGVAIVAALPTIHDVIKHGSYANAVAAMGEAYGVKAMITGLDDAVLSAEEISE